MIREKHAIELDETYSYLKKKKLLLVEKKKKILPNDAVRSDELELGISAVEGGLARGIGSDIAEITGVADLGGGSTVSHTVGVEVTTGRHASVGVVTELAIKITCTVTRY